MRKLLLLILLLATFKLNAQTHLIGLKGGLSLTNVTPGLFYEKFFNNRPGISGGISYEYQFKSKFYLGADLVYNERGYRTTTFLKNDNGSQFGKYNSPGYSLNYLSVPLKAGINFGEKFYGFVDAGIMPSFILLANTYMLILKEESLSYEKIDSREFTPKIDITLFNDVGAGFKINNKNRLFTSVSFQYGFTGVFKNEASGDKSRHIGLVFYAGLKHAIGK